MTSFDDAQSEDYNKLKTKTFDDMHDIKDDNPDRKKIKKYPAITDMVCDVIHKNERISIKSIQLKAITLGTSKIECDPRISIMRMKYESIVSHIYNDDDMKTYTVMRHQESYIFGTTVASSCSGINLYIGSREISILSDIAKYMGLYPPGLFIMAFLIGVRDSKNLNEYQLSKIDKEISSFWIDVDRRISYLSMLIPQNISIESITLST